MVKRIFGRALETLGIATRDNDHGSRHPNTVADHSASASGPYNRVGFFNPLGTPQGSPQHLAFGMINAYSLEQVEKSLIAAAGTKYQVNIDFSDFILERKTPSMVGSKYETSTGEIYSKRFPPLHKQKLSFLPDDITLAEKVRPFFSMLKFYEDNVGAIFLADEPYLNGISKAEMERAGVVARRELDAAGLSRIELGIIFASGMFDQDFSRHLDHAAGNYARRIDAYCDRGMAIKNGMQSDPDFNIGDFDSWVESIKTSRLTTYDAAGNMYIGGGIPSGYTVVAFDYYLSTMLLDDLHANILPYLASRFPAGPCRQHAGRTIASIRQSLSFFQDGPIKQGEGYLSSDRLLLDDLYECRMTDAFNLLRQAANLASAKIMMISESSSNGVMEYYANGAPKSGQPELLIESRVYDEVGRALDFYDRHRQDISGGLMFFLYDDAFDYSIDLRVHGASSLPSVIDRIYNFAAAPWPARTA